MAHLPKFPIGVPWHLLDYCNIFEISVQTSESMTHLSKTLYGCPLAPYDYLKHCFTIYTFSVTIRNIRAFTLFGFRSEL